MIRDIDNILAKYFSGEASAADLQQLDDWLAQSDANEFYFDEMTMLFEKTAMVSPSHRPDTSGALSKFEQYMQTSAEEKAEIKEEIGKTKTIRPRFYMQIAAVFILLVGVSVFLYLYRSPDESNVIQITAQASEINHLMPDSSHILLAENSEIIYEKDYGNKTKDIELTGKASFDVGSYGEGNLKITAGETFIKDIGTVFTVDAYPASPEITVSVEEGKVLFYSANNKGLELGAGETGIYNRSTKMFEKKIVGNKLAPDMIIFNATPLDEVVSVLNKKFNTAIKITDNNLNKLQITVSFAASDSIDNILQIIAETLLLKIQTEDNNYKIYPR